MNAKIYITISYILFFLIALMHIVRIIMSWEVTIGNMTAPMAISWVAAIVALIMGYFGFKNSKR